MVKEQLKDAHDALVALRKERDSLFRSLQVSREEGESLRRELNAANVMALAAVVAVRPVRTRVQSDRADTIQPVTETAERSVNMESKRTAATVSERVAPQEVLVAPAEARTDARLDEACRAHSREVASIMAANERALQTRDERHAHAMAAAEETSSLQQEAAVKLAKASADALVAAREEAFEHTKAVPQKPETAEPPPARARP